MKRSLLSRFRAAISNKLMAEIIKVRDFVVLVCISPKITIYNYVHDGFYLLILCCSLFVMLCLLLAIVLCNPHQWLVVFERSGGLFFVSLFRGGTFDAPPQRQRDIFLIWSILFFLGAVLWFLLKCRSGFRDFIGLLRLHRMTPQQRTELALQKFLHMSIPTWMSYTISYKPTPTELLKVLREHEQATTPLIQAIADALAQENIEDEDEDRPSFNLSLFITDCLICDMTEPGGKHMSLEINDSVVPLVGFFAVQDRGKWVIRRDVFKQVYDPGKEQAFGVHRDRANTQIIKHAQKAGILPEKEPLSAQSRDATPPAPTNTALEGKEPPASSEEILTHKDLDLLLSRFGCLPEVESQLMLVANSN